MDLDIQQACVITPLITHIIQHYIVGFYSALIVYDEHFEDRNNIYKNYECSLTEALITQNVRSTKPLVLQFMTFSRAYEIDSDGNNPIRNTFLANIELGLQAYIVITDDIEKFLDLKYEVQQVSEQRMRDHIFLFLSGFETNPSTILEHAAFDLYPNHLIVIPTDSSITEFELWTQEFAGTLHQNTGGILVDHYFSNGTFQKNSPLYWDKIWNLMGRPMTVSTVTYLPYSITELVAEGDGIVSEVNSTEVKTWMYDGTEARIVLEFCRLRNCTVQIMPFPGDYWGGIFNGTGEGQIGALYYNQVEFAIGCIYKWYSDVFDMSQSVAKSAVTLLVPAALPLSYALTPILPFDPSTWLFLFVTMNISVVLYYIIKMFSELLSHKDEVDRLSDVDRTTFRTSFRTTYLEVVAVFLQQSFDQGTSRIAVRTVYCVLLISGITLENAYSGGLKALLTIPRFHEKISTVHQFVQTGYHWGAPQPAWAFSIVHAQVPDDLAMYRRFESHSNEILHNKSFSRSYGIAIERLHAGSYSFNDYVQMDSLIKQDMLKEDVYYDFSNGYAVRGWPLMEHFDEIAMQVTQHGLLNRWETEIINGYLNLTIENYLRALSAGHTESAGPEVLRVAHIIGPLCMLFVGVITASIMFFAEHAVYRFYKK